MLEQKYRDNFKILSDLLLKENYDLDMTSFFGDVMLNEEYYYSTKENFLERFNECGTSCCALGLAAISKKLHARLGESSKEHCIRVFGIHSMKNEDIWNYVFNEHWGNSKTAASKRALYVSKHGQAPIINKKKVK